MFGREISLRRAFRANCAAMRLQLVEIHDLPSCPPSLRDALTDFLAFSENLAGAYDPVGPLLRRALERTKARRIVDLCSGAGGPWRRLGAEVGVPVILTGLYPSNSTAFARSSPRFTTSDRPRRGPSSPTPSGEVRGSACSRLPAGLRS